MELSPENGGSSDVDGFGGDTRPGRKLADRRVRATTPSDALRLRGQRVRPRREDERRGAYFVDRFDTVTLAVTVTLLLLTIADGVLTIELLDTNSEEMNPLMARLLLHGQQAFLVGKYVLTAAGIPFIVVYKNYPLFGSRFRIGFLLPIFVGLYVLLISYQTRLLNIGPEERSLPRPCLSPQRMRTQPVGKGISNPAGLAHVVGSTAIGDDLIPIDRQSPDLCPIRSSRA